MRQERCRALVHGTAVDEPAAPHLVPGKDVLRDVEIGKQQRLLMDQADPGRQGGAWIGSHLTG